MRKSQRGVPAIVSRCLESSAVRLVCEILMCLLFGLTAEAAYVEPLVKTTTDLQVMSNVSMAQGFQCTSTPGGTPIERAVKCLACNIYFEAGHEADEHAELVAYVTLNRYYNWGRNSVCSVVWQGSNLPRRRGAQFSWTNNGRADRMNDASILEKSLRLAKNVMLQYHAFGISDDDAYARIKRESDHYHADYVDPLWADGVELLTDPEGATGTHVFYTSNMNERIVQADFLRWAGQEFASLRQGMSLLAMQQHLASLVSVR